MTEPTDTTLRNFVKWLKENGYVICECVHWEVAKITDYWETEDDVVAKYYLNKRSESTCCIDRGDNRTSWCGRSIVMEFAFVNLEHALLAAQQGSRLTICEPCRVAATDALMHPDGPPLRDR